MGTRMRSWWRDDPADPDVTSPDDPDVRRLVAEVAPGGPAAALGGCCSLNMRLPSVGLVMRVQQRFITRRRVLALQEIRRRLARTGLVVAEPRSWQGKELLTCRGRWTELETYVPHEKPAATWESYRWMYRGMGRLHRALADLDGIDVPRPPVSTYGPPSSLRRWLAVTEPLVRHDPKSAEVTALVRRLLGPLTTQWIPATRLPGQLIHGDLRLGNVGLTPSGETVYLDFGFAATRPRIHDLAYSLSWVVLRPDGRGTAEDFGWERVPELVKEYEQAAHTRLTAIERTALAPYTAAVPLYSPAIVGHAADPVALIRDDRDAMPFVRISEWLLANPGAVLGSEAPT